MGNEVAGYKSWDLDDLKDQQALVNAGSSGIGKFPDGESYWRFLPAPAGEAPLEITWKHFVPGVDDGPMVVINCPHRMKHASACPVCQLGGKLQVSGTASDRELAQRIRPQLRVFARAYSADDEDAVIQVLAFGKTVFDALIGFRTQKRGGGDPMHPDTGYLVMVRKTGEGLKTRYTLTPNQVEPIDVTILDNMPPMAHQSAASTREEIMTAVAAISSQAVEGFDDPPVAAPRRAPGGRPAAAAPQGLNPPRPPARPPVRPPVRQPTAVEVEASVPDDSDLEY